MKTVIYQYWDGPDTTGNTAGSAAMADYAKAIGAEYIYEKDPKFVTDLGQYSPHYGSFKPIYDSRFDDYDYILFADTDVFPVEGLTENIFEQFYDTDYDIGICEEWAQPEFRKQHTIAGINNANDRKWASLVKGKYGADVPKTEDGTPRVYNSGVVVYSKQGRNKCAEKFPRFNDYVKAVKLTGLPAFYTCDQPYLHAMIHSLHLKWKLMDYRWNSSVHYLPGGAPRKVNDLRDNPNFVHIQLNGADHFDKDTLHRVTNLPVEQWSLG